MNSIYLDYNATTPIAPVVQEAMLPFISEYYGNPSSGHTIGRVCQEAIEESRARVASCIGADRDEIIFTSGGTESNNLALIGVLRALTEESHRQGGRTRTPGHIVISAIEHPAIVEPAKYLESIGYDVSVVNCNMHGVVDPGEIEQAIRADTCLVSVMHANNEVGTLQPIAEIGGICRSRDILFHTDAAQTIGKARVVVRELNVDLLTIAGHKIYAPKGVGALYVRKGVVVHPVLHGANHERGVRPGTENVPYIVALGKACQHAYEHCDEAIDRMASLRDDLYERLSREIDGLVVHGFQAERLPNTLSVAFPGVLGHELLNRADDVCASTGSACHTGLKSLSPTLTAMKISDELAAGTVRLSIGWYTTEGEIERAASRLIDAWESLQ